MNPVTCLFDCRAILGDKSAFIEHIRHKAYIREFCQNPVRKSVILCCTEDVKSRKVNILAPIVYYDEMSRFLGHLISPFSHEDL